MVRIKKFDLTAALVDGSKRILHEFACEASAAIGDVVYCDPATDNKVLVNTDNLEFERSIGVIESKLTDIRCEVCVLGFTGNTYAGLTQAEPVFLSVTGTITSIQPTGGYSQMLGICYDATAGKILVNPEYRRIKRA